MRGSLTTLAMGFSMPMLAERRRPRMQHRSLPQLEPGPAHHGYGDRGAHRAEGLAPEAAGQDDPLGGMLQSVLAG